MKKVWYYSFALIAILLSLSFTISNINDETPYKCMVQMANYNGEGAYIAMSIVNDQGRIVKTLKVYGDDREYLPELKQWWKSHKANKKITAADALSGETMAGGERQIFTIRIPSEYINKNYSLKFETAVENDIYEANDVVIPLMSNTLKQKTEGKGYIRYVRLIPVK